MHVYGGRWSPFGNVNYPEEIEKVRQMTVIRDRRLWAAAKGGDWRRIGSRYGIT